MTSDHGIPQHSPSMNPKCSSSSSSAVESGPLDRHLNKSHVLINNSSATTTIASTSSSASSSANSTLVPKLGSNGTKTFAHSSKKVSKLSKCRRKGVAWAQPNSKLATTAPECGSGAGPLLTRQAFLEIVRESNILCQKGDFVSAIKLYNEALLSDPSNHILHSNRSAALIKLGCFDAALRDANKAASLQPKWPKAHYRQGVALQCLGKHAQAIASFSRGLALDPKSSQLLAGLIEASLKSPLKCRLESTFCELSLMKLTKCAFVVISVVGQELLAFGSYNSAATVLESALRIGTNNVKLNGSVLSALSSAYWAMNQLDKAISYMQADLAVAKAEGDLIGECRAHGNLGSAFFTKANYKAALTSHRYQLVLAMKAKDTNSATTALTSLGHVYTAIGDYANALASHKQCVQLTKQLGHTLHEAREIGNVGAVYLAMGDFGSAVECHMEHLRLAKQLGDKVEEARAYSNLGSSHHFSRDFEAAINFHNHVLQIAHELGDHNIETRAYAGLGHASRARGDLSMAKLWHEKQLDMALATKDRLCEGRACSNLGIVFQMLGDFESALKLHQVHLSLSNELHDRSGVGRALGNIGNAYNALGFHEAAVKYYKKELWIAKEVCDRSSEAATHGNLAVAYQSLGLVDKALVHYRSHLCLSRELKDSQGEACALLNLGNCFSSLGDFPIAMPYFEQYLMLSQELGDVAAEERGCHLLGFIHFQLGNYAEAVRYYKQDLVLAKVSKHTLGHAYCNLGFAYLAMGKIEDALQCQTAFLAVSETMKDWVAMSRALNNLATIYAKGHRYKDALCLFNKQLNIATAASNKAMEAMAHGAIGNVHRQMRNYQLALLSHIQELSIFRDLNDVIGECRAHGNLGATQMLLGDFEVAIQSYESMLSLAKELNDDHKLEAQAHANLGIARMNLCAFQQAAICFGDQLRILDSHSGNGSGRIASTSSIEDDKCQACINLGDCLLELGHYKDAICCFEKALNSNTNLILDQQIRCTRSIAMAYKAMGDVGHTIDWLEKRLAIANAAYAHEQTKDKDVYRIVTVGLHELGLEYQNGQGDFVQAATCFDQQLALLVEHKDKSSFECEALLNLGHCRSQLGNHAFALQLLERALTCCAAADTTLQIRAFKEISAVHESMGNYETALVYQEQRLNMAASSSSVLKEKVDAFCCIGRLHHVIGNHVQAMAYLQEAIAVGKQIDIDYQPHYFLALVLWKQGELASAEFHMQTATKLMEEMHQKQNPSLLVFDRQMAAYHTMQKILVALGKTDEALLTAEKCKSVAMTTLQQQRQSDNSQNANTTQPTNCKVIKGEKSAQPIQMDLTPEAPFPNSVSALLDRVNQQKTAAFLFYSISGRDLFAWLLIPHKGIVKFHQISVDDVAEGAEEGAEGEDEEGLSMASLIASYVHRVQNALGVDGARNCVEGGAGEDKDGVSLWATHVEELGDRLNSSDRTGFLHLLSRNHRFNCSSYSLSSLFSVGSASGSVKSVPSITATAPSVASASSREGSTRSSYKVRSSRVGCGSWSQSETSCIRALHRLLIAPFDPELELLDELCIRHLYLVLDSALLLVPFAILRNTPTQPNLCERFKLIVAPSILSIRELQQSNTIAVKDKEKCGELGRALIVGAPTLPSSVIQQWNWPQIPRAENEAKMVAELLSPGTSPPRALVNAFATKGAVLDEISACDVVHLATHVSWKLSGIVLGPMTNNENGADVAEEGAPPLCEFLLTAAEILELRLQAKLVVLSCFHSRETPIVHVDSDSSSLSCLARAFLAAGASCVLVALWPVPEIASRIFFRSLYSSLLQGTKVSAAFAEAICTVQHTKHFAHPANWSGYLLIGSDVALNSQSTFSNSAIWNLVKAMPVHERTTRDALRVTLHLVEKSLQRIAHGQKTAMFTTQKSIENKVGVGVCVGWKEVLVSVGFRFEGASINLPAAVFFPQEDVGERLAKCSECLQAVLGLPSTVVNLLSQLDSCNDKMEEIVTLLRRAIAMTTTQSEDAGIEVTSKLWETSSEFLQSIGFQLIREDKDGNVVEILLANCKSSIRLLQFTLAAALSLCDAISEKSRDTDYTNLPVNVKSHSHVDTQSPSGQQIDVDVESAHARAFRSFVRRGEPDGHTTNKSTFPAIQPTTRGHVTNGVTCPPRVANVRRPFELMKESSSASAKLSVRGYENQYEVNKAMMKDGAADVVVSPPAWIHPKTGHQSKSQSQVSFNPSAHANGDLSLVESRRRLSLGLAPSLSNLILAKQISLCQLIEDDGDEIYNNKTDVEESGAISMDDSISAFAHESDTEDRTRDSPVVQSAVKKVERRFPRIPNDREKMDLVVPTPMRRRTLPSSSVLVEVSSHMVVSSSESSPSDMSRRDDGDGRSLTDSQYGSYSPCLNNNNTHKLISTTKIIQNDCKQIHSTNQKSSEC